jgi:hypothetical protein
MQNVLTPAPASIAAACALCASRFDRYLLHPFPGTEERAQRLKADLHLWIDNFSVHGHGLLSLDSLLRSNSRLLKRLLFLLNNTAENLGRGE